MEKFVDSFIKNFSLEKDIEKRFDILLDFVNQYYDGHSNVVNEILNKELKHYVEIKNIDGEALIRFMFAYSALENGDFKKGQEEVENVMSLFDKLTNHDIKAQILNFFAFINSHQGNFDKAFEYCYESIKEAELSKNKKNQFWGQYTLGVFYFDLKDYSNSEKYFQEALAGFMVNNNPYGVARSETGLASIYIQKENFDEAEILLKRSLEYYKLIETITGHSRCLNDLGIIYKKTGKNSQAVEYFKESLQLRRISNHQQGIATSLIEIADILILIEDYENAKPYLLEAKNICENINNRGKLFRTHLLYYQLYKKTNNPWKALEHLELYDKIKSEVLSETANNKIKELQTRMATEKSEKEAEIERLKNVELRNANMVILEKQKEILDSINYAKRIQQSLMPTEKYIEKSLQKKKL